MLGRRTHTGMAVKSACCCPNAHATTAPMAAPSRDAPRTTRKASSTKLGSGADVSRGGNVLRKNQATLRFNSRPQQLAGLKPKRKCYSDLSVCVAKLWVIRRLV